MATNTLVFTNIPADMWTSPKLFLDILENEPLHTVYLTAFGRVLCVFPSSLIAQKIKSRLHLTPILNCVIGVYFAQQTTSTAPTHAQMLAVPPLVRNFLTSPPGSPCQGWMQRVEDPPVKIDGTCADILKHAYSYSDDDALVAFSLDGGRLVDLSVDKEGDAESRGQLLRFGDKDEMPIIHIEFAAETGSKSGSRETLMPRTALPPC